MKDIQHVFFDLDHTLWDFERSSQEALVELFDAYRGHIGEVPLEDFLGHYRRFNRDMWRLYEQQKVEWADLRRRRWELTFEALKVPMGDWMQKIGLDYLNLCPRKPYLVDGAVDALSHVGTNYRVHLLTNGLMDTQSVKLKYSGLDVYFEEVITSDHANARKPDRKIFDYALDRAGALPENALYVGDNYESDVEGGLNAGWQVIFFNPDQLDNPVQVPQITHLEELRALL